MTSANSRPVSRHEIVGKTIDMKDFSSERHRRCGVGGDSGASATPLQIGGRTRRPAAPVPAQPPGLRRRIAGIDARRLQGRRRFSSLRLVVAFPQLVGHDPQFSDHASPTDGC